ncbi:MAG: lytic transglycosylase domain-containing protein [Spirochaetota bacterium]|nr:lytic transglycosylase domain-containing protein [Spirochaetota bacterium]
MTEGMNIVLNRITEIRKKFISMRHNIADNITKSQRFDNKAKENFQIKQTNNDTSIPEIKKTANEIARINRVPPSLVNAVIEAESGYRPNAVSNKGALGLMQLMPSVIKNIGISNPFDIQENIKGGVTILKGLLEKYDGDYKKALAAYNAGEKAVDDNNGIPPYKETKEYIQKVINAYLKNAQ